MDIFSILKEIFVGSKVYDDETANETVDETDDDQPGTTDMPDLESEESAEQRYTEKDLTY